MDPRDHYSKNANGLALCWQVQGLTQNLHPIIFSDDRRAVTCPGCLKALKNERILVIEIGRLPDPDLSPNARVHWVKRSAAAKAARYEAYYLAREQWPAGKAPMLYAEINYFFTDTQIRRRDQDNLIAACKPWQDGLVDAGVLVQDDTEHLRIGAFIYVKGEKRSTRITVIEIAEIFKE